MDDTRQIQVANILASAIIKCKAQYLKMLFLVDDMQSVNNALEGFEFESKVSDVYGVEYYEITIKVR